MPDGAQHWTLMIYPGTKRFQCSVCGLETFRHREWFLVVENRWLDRLKILSWHSSLAAQKGMKSVCSRQHLKILVAHWLTQSSLRLYPTDFCPQPGYSEVATDAELGPDAVGRLVGELAIHRETFSRVWSGSPETLESILEALITIGAENRPHALEFHLFDRPEPTHGLSLQ